MNAQIGSKTIHCTRCTAGKVEDWIASHGSGCKDCDVCYGTGLQMIRIAERSALQWLTAQSGGNGNPSCTRAQL